MELINDELRKKFEQYPLGSQDGKGFDAVCIAKYFVGNCTWLATEAEFDDENEEVLLYGYADLGLGPDCSEWGYFSLSELEDVTVPPYGLKVERDLYADGKTVRQLCDEIGLEYIDYMSQNTHTIYRASAYQVDDALMAIGNAIYELEDKIHGQQKSHNTYYPKILFHNIIKLRVLPFPHPHQSAVSVPVRWRTAARHADASQVPR